MRFSELNLRFLEYIDADTKLILTDYDNRRCLDNHQSKRISIPDEQSIVSSEKSQTDSNTTNNQTLFKIRTRG